MDDHRIHRETVAVETKARVVIPVVQSTYPDLQRRIGDIDSISLSQAVEQNVHIAIVTRQAAR